MSTILNLSESWLPWLNLYIEGLLLQVLILLSISFFILARNLFYSAIYMFLTFCLLGILICYINVELFTGFLWVVELTVFFIVILFLFYLNFEGSLIPRQRFFLKLVYLVGIPLLFSFFDDRSSSVMLLSSYFTWDNYYEALFNDVANDIHALFLSYYCLNSLIFIIFGFIIFITTIVCIMILRCARLTYAAVIAKFLGITGYFTSFTSYEFLRKQNMFFQGLRRPVTTLAQRGFLEWYKKEQRLEW